MAFTMEVPDKAAIKSEVEEQIKPVSEEVAQLQAVAERNVAEILTLYIDEFAKKKHILQSIKSFGATLMKNSALKVARFFSRVSINRYPDYFLYNAGFITT